MPIPKLPKRGVVRLVALLGLAVAGCAGQTQEAPTTGPAIGLPPAVPDVEAAAPPTDRLRVLFIGNSYTYVNDLPFQIQQIAESAGAELPLEVVSVTPGGMTLERHWDSGSPRRLIRQGGWTHVVLQEQSTRPIDDPDNFYEYARRFAEEIDRVGARTVFYLTWARQHRPTSQDTLSHAYLTAAWDLGAWVAPVGIAWQRALEEDPTLVLHTEDRSHPGPTGTYLAALVFYAALFDAPIADVTSTRWTSHFGERETRPGYAGGRRPAEEIEPLADATTAMLQRIASEAIGSVRPSAPEPEPLQEQGYR